MLVKPKARRLTVNLVTVYIPIIKNLQFFKKLV